PRSDPTSTAPGRNFSVPKARSVQSRALMRLTAPLTLLQKSMTSILQTILEIAPAPTIALGSQPSLHSPRPAPRGRWLVWINPPQTSNAPGFIWALGKGSLITTHTWHRTSQDGTTRIASSIPSNGQSKHTSACAQRPKSSKNPNLHQPTSLLSLARWVHVSTA